MRKKPIESQQFIQRCFDLAYQARGRQSPNPMVGAVITVDQKIIGEGYHQQYGDNHAEINAIQAVKDPQRLKEASIFVSLEPCFHFGKTPPCVQTIMHEGFKSVAISVQDINPLTAGRSVQALKANHQQVQENILFEKGQELIRHFSTNIRLNRPFIVLKYATSQDGFLGQKDKQVWLSNPFSKRLAHLWRSKFDAILVGGQTVRTDNPRLSTRYFNSINPLRIVLSKSDFFKKNLHIFDNNAPTIIASLNNNMLAPNPQTEIFQLDASRDYLKDLMEYLLAQKKVGTIIIEGGRQTLQSFIDADLWDEARIFRTPKILGHGIPEPILKKAVLHQRFPLDTDEVWVFRKSS